MTGHKIHLVRFRAITGWVVAACRCGWSVSVTNWQAADHAAETHCLDVAPDLPVVHGRDDGGHWWEPEHEAERRWAACDSTGTEIDTEET